MSASACNARLHRAGDMMGNILVRQINRHPARAGLLLLLVNGAKENAGGQVSHQLLRFRGIVAGKSVDRRHLHSSRGWGPFVCVERRPQAEGWCDQCARVRPVERVSERIYRRRNRLDNGDHPRRVAPNAKRCGRPIDGGQTLVDARLGKGGLMRRFVPLIAFLTFALVPLPAAARPAGSSGTDQINLPRGFARKALRAAGAQRFSSALWSTPTSGEATYVLAPARYSRTLTHQRAP